MNPSISVIMPAYNVNTLWLGKAIESILNQTFNDFELIIVDDGSTNETYSVCEQYNLLDSRIRLFQFTSNKGIADAMNFGILKALGKYIAIQDSDDISLLTRLEKQYEYLQEHPETVLLGTQMDITFQETVSETYKANSLKYLTWYNSIIGIDLEREFIKSNCLANGTAMYHRKKAIEAGLYNKHYRQLLDWEFFLRLSHFGKVEKLAEILYMYRRHTDSFCYEVDMSELMGEIHVNYLNKYLKKESRVAFWGTGAGGVGFLKAYEQIENKNFFIELVIDGSSKKTGETISGYFISSPYALKDSNELDFVLIAVSISQAVIEIKNILRKLGYGEDKLIELYPIV